MNITLGQHTQRQLAAYRDALVAGGNPDAETDHPELLIIWALSEAAHSQRELNKRMAEMERRAALMEMRR